MNENNATALIDYLDAQYPGIKTAPGIYDLLTVLQEMQGIDEQIEELKEARKEARERAAAIVGRNVYSSAAQLGINPLEFASVLYWLADAYLSATQILSPLGHSANTSAKRMVRPLIVAHCKCGEPLTVATRSDLQSYQTERRRGKLHLFRRHLCSECKRADEQLSTARRAAEEQVYLQRLAELRSMPYRQYLQSDEWKERRRRALKRAGFCCQVCNSAANLNVHHRTYIRRGAERNDDLLVLCQPCHELFHKQGKLARGGE